MVNVCKEDIRNPNFDATKCGKAKTDKVKAVEELTKLIEFKDGLQGKKDSREWVEAGTAVLESTKAELETAIGEVDTLKEGIGEGEGTRVTGGAGNTNGIVGVVFFRDENHEGGVEIRRKGGTRDDMKAESIKSLKNRGGV